jgi:hypothetical protein
VVGSSDDSLVREILFDLQIIYEDNCNKGSRKCNILARGTIDLLKLVTVHI